MIEHAPVTLLKGVGTKIAEKLHKLNIFCIKDLLFHLPCHYENRSKIYAIAALTEGTQSTVEGQITHSKLLQRKKRRLICNISDTTGSMQLIFFNSDTGLLARLRPGNFIRCFGEVSYNNQGPAMVHPEYHFFAKQNPLPADLTLTPVYPTTEGIRQISIKNFCQQALKLIHKEPLTDFLPPAYRYQQWEINKALLWVHYPPTDSCMQQLAKGKYPAQQRLALEELIAHNLSRLQLRQIHKQQQAISLLTPKAILANFLASQTITPTKAQQRVISEIAQDLQLTKPMLRLLQGDVGSGKTFVAAQVILYAIGNSQQAALMVPTEILAEQHAINFYSWFEPMGFNVACLTAKQTGNIRKKLLQQLAIGNIHLIIGTHALFQEQVKFYRLALIIIDEQHRFGVHQRLSLREKGSQKGYYPHQLIMTATPIPRTLAMTTYADLDHSVIDELPPNRKPVTTVTISSQRRAQVIERVYRACHQEHRQAYWVCTLIETSEAFACQAAEDTLNMLQQALPNLNIGLVHGRMKSVAKQQVMSQFKRSEIDVLVATTVIEVGVDVPNANLMIIENPERLGLAQLHQLRGRIGRGAIVSYCLLLYNDPLSYIAKQRLTALKTTNDGFLIAQKDLEIRGQGELLGVKQTGLIQLKIADILRDKQLIPEAHKLAMRLQQVHPQQMQPLVNRWLANKAIYSQA